MWKEYSVVFVFFHRQTSIVITLITLSSGTKIFLKMHIRTLNDDWNASRSAVGILRRVHSLAISAPVVDNSNLQNYLIFGVWEYANKYGIRNILRCSWFRYIYRSQSWGAFNIVGGRQGNCNLIQSMISWRWVWLRSIAFNWYWNNQTDTTFYAPSRPTAIDSCLSIWPVKFTR